MAFAFAGVLDDVLLFAVLEFAELGWCLGNTGSVSIRSVSVSISTGMASCGTRVDWALRGNTHEPLTLLMAGTSVAHSAALSWCDACRSGSPAAGVLSSISGSVAMASHIEVV